VHSQTPAFSRRLYRSPAMLDVPLLALSGHSRHRNNLSVIGIRADIGASALALSVSVANDPNWTLRRLNPFVSGRCLM